MLINAYLIRSRGRKTTEVSVISARRREAELGTNLHNARATVTTLCSRDQSCRRLVVKTKEIMLSLLSASEDAYILDKIR